MSASIITRFTVRTIKHKVMTIQTISNCNNDVALLNVKHLIQLSNLYIIFLYLYRLIYIFFFNCYVSIFVDFIDSKLISFKTSH